MNPVAAFFELVVVAISSTVDRPDDSQDERTLCMACAKGNRLAETKAIYGCRGDIVCENCGKGLNVSFVPGV